MGFYLELGPAGQNEYREHSVPPVFWILYGLAGFALCCMFGAAYTLLGDLARAGSTFDRVLILSILSAVPFYLAIGVKLAWIKKFVRFDGAGLTVGFRLGKWEFWKRSTTWSSIQSIELVNQRPTANLAVRQHGDAQYHIRGHWRILVKEKAGKEFVADRHTEKEMLEPLYLALTSRLI